MADSKIPVCFDIDLKNIRNTTGSIVPLFSAADKARMASLTRGIVLNLVIGGIESAYAQLKKSPIHKENVSEFERRIGAVSSGIEKSIDTFFGGIGDLLAPAMGLVVKAGNSVLDALDIGDTDIENLEERLADHKSRLKQAKKDLEQHRRESPDEGGLFTLPAGFSLTSRKSSDVVESNLLRTIAESQKEIERLKNILAGRGISPKTQRQQRSIGNTRSNLDASLGRSDFFDAAPALGSVSAPSVSKLYGGGDYIKQLNEQLSAAANLDALNKPALPPLGRVPLPSVNALYGESNISARIGGGEGIAGVVEDPVQKRTRDLMENMGATQNWSAGVQAAYADISASANDWGAISQDLTHKVFAGMTDAVVDFATTGKANFSDFAASLIQDLLRISTQQLLVNSLSGFSFFGTPGVKAAKGAVIDHGRIQAFARGGVVSQPAYFGLRNGIGLMGEAGPEAIMPLRRGRGGKLGVAAEAPPPPPVNVRVVNITDPREITTAMNTGAGERVILNTIVNNHDTVRKLLRVP